MRRNDDLVISGEIFSPRQSKYYRDPYFRAHTQLQLQFAKFKPEKFRTKATLIRRTRVETTKTE